MSDSTAGAQNGHEQIASEVLRVHRDSYGTGAEDVVVHTLDDMVVVLLDKLELPAGERLLIDNGHSQKVLSMRSAFQQAIEPTFTAIIERGTGRRVSSFLSTTHLDPSYSVELFRLRPVLA
jgi:uncharacterized protein YbcI